MSATPGRSLGGRFTESTDPVLERINRSIGLDIRLWRHDIAGSRAHAEMLGAVGLLSGGDVSAILDGLAAIEAEFEADTFVVLPSDEDIHMAVERRLSEQIGEPARRLHTGRSRNDQVMTDTLLWLREALDAHGAALAAWVEVLLRRAEDAASVPMPSFTHSQPAQVSAVGQWLLVHAVEGVGLLRRLVDLRARLSRSPLGSGASAGGYLPLDRDLTAAALGFDGPAVNATQATGSRLDLLDAVGWCGLVGAAISRLGEELVLFASPAYGFVRLPDRLTTGSSLLPHKRNPDGAEILRGEGRRLPTLFASMASIQSGLVSGYSKDLQADKRILFEASDLVADLVALSTVHIDAASWNVASLRRACTPELAALWLADALVLAGMPFREAHHRVGLASRHAADEGISLAEAFGELAGDDPTLLAVHAGLEAQTTDSLLAGLRTAGSAGPASIEAQVAVLRAELAALRGR
jgi:argininosuccinate lyase